MPILTVKFSEDFRETRVANEIYVRLRNNNLNPLLVRLNYFPGIGEGEVLYSFGEPNNLPEESELVKILQGIKFRKLTLK